MLGPCRSVAGHTCSPHAGQSARYVVRDFPLDVERILRRMEALLFTVGAVALIVGGLYLFARAWPRQPDAPTVGGYRAQMKGERDASSDPVAAAGVREEDGAPWQWRAPEEQPAEKGGSADPPRH